MNVKERLLREGAEKLGVVVNREQIICLFEYMDILDCWNKKMNLTAITEEKDVVIKHLLDSFTCAATGYVSNGLKAIDIGTGAGFPGLPLKIIYPGLGITLLDSVKKRITFLKHVIIELNLKNVTPIHARAEELARDSLHREAYDLCFARAVAQLSVIAEYCLPFLKTGGVFLAMKGPEYQGELSTARRAIELLGGRLTRVQQFCLPFTDITRHIIIIEKMKPTKAEYPRKAGRPAKKPLN